MKLLETDHINDIYKHLPGNSLPEEFKVIQRDNYQVIDYVFVNKDSFDHHDILLECRGIKFDLEGNLIARPFHKFFNVNEKESLDDIDFTKEHHILEKLDGSMVHTCVLDNEVRLMTRKGITEVSLFAEKEVFQDKDLRAKIYSQSHRTPSGFTLVFEYVSPNNRIVIQYKKPELYLLAVRELQSGRYLPRKEVNCIARKLGIKTPSKMKFNSLNEVSDLLDKEGIVITFNDGHFLKMKADDYLMKHRAASYFDSKKQIVNLVMSGAVDDQLSFFDDESQEKLLVFNDACFKQLYDDLKKIKSKEHLKNLDRKTFAQTINKEIDRAFRPFYFKFYDGYDDAQLMQMLKKFYSQNYDLIKPTW